MNKNKLKNTLSQQQIQDLDKKIENLTPSVRLVANYYFGTANIRKSIFVSQTLVAKKLGICRKTVNRALKLLHELGIITKIDRGWKEDRTRIKKTCYYIINKLFFYQEIRNRYKHIFLALSYLVIFCNFESIFGIWSKDERQQYNGVVSGIKSYTNSLFINTNTKLRISSNYQRRDKTTYCSSTYNRSNVVQKNKDVVLNRSIIYTYAEFNDEAKKQLSVFPDKVHIEAIQILKGKTNLVNPVGYYRGVCIKICQRMNILYEQPDIGKGVPQLTLPIRTPSVIGNDSVVLSKNKSFKEEIKQPTKQVVIPEETLDQAEKARIVSSFKGHKACYLEALKRYERFRTASDLHWANDYKRNMDKIIAQYPYLFKDMANLSTIVKDNTPVHIANEIGKILQTPIADNSFKPELIKLRERVIENWAMKPYEKTGETGEELAIEYIMNKRKKYQEPSIPIPVKHVNTVEVNLKPQENTKVLENTLSLYGKFEPESITPNEEGFDEVLD